MKIVLCGFGNPDNRGCEAIIRSTTAMTKKVFPQSEIVVTSNDFGRVDMPELDTVDCYDFSYYPHNNVLDAYIYAGFRRLFGSARKWCSIRNSAAYRRIGRADLCISVGGDNFCYSNNIDHFLVHHEHFKSIGAKLVHWGSSFEESLMGERLKADLNRFDAIMVRESISYNTLEEAGINSPLYLIPDPAFTMEPAAPAEGLPIEKSCVGLNISPLIISKESRDGIVQKNTVRLINHITHSGKQVVLIPHVASRKTGEGDYSVMKALLNEVEQPDRCLLLGYGYTAPEIKYIISQCSMFIGARTHATIAAYSSCVPTVVIGYSVKARGIAKDLFGREKDYVLPVQALKTVDDFTNAYTWLEAHADDIRTRLREGIPAYIEKASVAETVLTDVMKGNAYE